MNTLYEILIRFDDTGKLKGAHVIEKDSITKQEIGPRAIKDSDWPVIVQGINTVAINKALETDSKLVEAEAKQAEHIEILQILNETLKKGDITELETKLELAVKPEIDRKKEELDEQIKKLEEERSALDAKKIEEPVQ